jgi:hypothetical protein
MTAMMKLRVALVLGLSAGVVSLAAVAKADDPLMGKSPWNFTPQNRAAIAVAIKNVEDPGSGGSGAGTIVCGGTSGASGQGATGSAASAAANSSCIIINNSDGAIVHNDQDSHGNQDADSTTSTTTHNNAAPKGGSIDDVAAILNGDKQGL